MEIPYLFIVLAITFLVMLPLYWLIDKRILYNNSSLDHQDPLKLFHNNAFRNYYICKKILSKGSF